MANHLWENHSLLLKQALNIRELTFAEEKVALVRTRFLRKHSERCQAWFKEVKFLILTVALSLLEKYHGQP
jgi:hypothetical protein